MIVERTKDENIVSLPAYVGLSELQNMLDYLQHKELTAQSTAKQSDVEWFSKAVNISVWTKIKARLALK